MDDIPLDAVIYWDECTHTAAGVVSDADSAPTFEIFENATDTAIVSGTMTKRTSKTGDYRGTTTLSAANGYDVGKFYNIVESATVGGTSAKKKAMTFRVVPAEAQAGYPSVNAEMVDNAFDVIDQFSSALNTRLASGVSISGVESTQSLGNSIVSYGFVALNATSQSRFFLVVDENGKEKTGLTHASFTAHYSAMRDEVFDITLHALLDVADAYSSGGLCEISATKFPGWYRLDVPDAAFINLDKVLISLVGPSTCRVSVNEVTVSNGVKLTPDGLDDIDNTEPSGAPTGWRQRMMLLAMRFLNKGDLNRTTGSQKIYKADGSVASNQTVTESGDTQSRTIVS